MLNKLIIATVSSLAAISASAENIFTSLDANVDGAISKEEASFMPDLVKQWDVLDADTNGELNIDEFSSYSASEIVSDKSGVSDNVFKSSK